MELCFVAVLIFIMAETNTLKDVIFLKITCPPPLKKRISKTLIINIISFELDIRFLLAPSDQNKVEYS